jgi:signal transduction histidine kinase
MKSAGNANKNRIAQEALGNALKHARASSINVTLNVEQEHVRLEIRDDGRGVSDLGHTLPGLGLRTMQYRASMIGARFEMTSLRPNGIRIICECPNLDRHR